MASCKYCRKDIAWIKEGRKNVPIEGDGTTHRCEEMQTSLKSMKTISLNTLSPEQIKKYEDSINQKVQKDAEKRSRRTGR